MARADRNRVYLGIDVGTGSARAGVFDGSGRMLAPPRAISRSGGHRRILSSNHQTTSGAPCAKRSRRRCARRRSSQPGVCGVGFDATCSLVVLDEDNRPVTVSPDGRDEQNVVVWMDHRALEQSQRINATGHAVLKYVGGRISPEMETPKLLWLKENLPQTWQRAARFMDLPDFLVYRATGEDVRSLCSTVCKWTYLGHQGETAGGWDDSYFRQVGLADLVDEQYRRIGTRVRPVGEAVGQGLTPAAASELGLEPGTAVGVSIIDAHAGGLGMLGAPLGGQPVTPEALEARIALIGGTSSCHMAVSREPRYIDRRLGPVLLGDGAGHVADRRRAVGHRGAHRPRDLHACPGGGAAQCGRRAGSARSTSF